MSSPMNVLADAAAAAPFEVRVVRIRKAGWMPGGSTFGYEAEFSNQVVQWVPAENFIDPDGKVCEALKRWELSQQGDVLTEHQYDAALDDEVGPPSDPESDDGGSDFVADDASDDDDE